MIAAVCPQPLLLLPEYSSRTDPAAPIRDACLTAVGELVAAGPRRISVVAAAPSGQIIGSEPAGVRVARQLLRLAGVGAEEHVVVLPTDAPGDEAVRQGRELADEQALLVMADGAYLRDGRAPKEVAERSRAYDRTWRSALRAGSPAQLAALDVEVATSLGVSGRAPLQVLAAATADRSVSAQLVYEADPFGVAYAVAVWRCE